MTKLCKTLTFIVAASLTTFAQARFKGTYTGAFMDSSYNMMTATAVTTSDLRISFHNSTNSTKWVADVSPPTDWSFTGNQCVTEDSSGDVYAVSMIYDGAEQRFEIFEIPSGNGTPVSLTYNPYSSGYPGSATPLGLFVGYGGDVYLVGAINDSTFDNPQTIIGQFPGSLASTTTTSTVGTILLGDDAVMDGSYNIYVSGIDYFSGHDQMSVSQWATNVSGSPGLSNNWTGTSEISTTYSLISGGSGCLTLDSSGNSAYFVSADNLSSQAYAMGFQVNSSGTTNWTLTDFPLGTGYTTISSSVADSSGNIYLAVSGSSSGYETSKITSAGAKSYLDAWSVAGHVPSCIAMDESGDYLVAASDAAGADAIVQRFHANGSFVITYDHAPDSGSASTYLVFGTGTAGDFYTFGSNTISGTAYPGIYYWTGDTISWGEVLE